MNQAYPDLIFNGVMLGVCIQLVLLAVFYFVKGQFRLVILGALCFLVSAIFINNLYWNHVKQNLWLSLLLGGGKNLFFPPLIYLYVSLASIPKEKWKWHSVKHLALPFLFHLTYLMVKFGFSDYYATNYYIWALSLSYLTFLLSLFYFILGIIHGIGLKENGLTAKVKRRYRFFLMAMLGYYFLINLYTILQQLTGASFFVENYYVLNRYLFMPLGLLANTFLLVFSITEFFKFKSLFVPRLVHQPAIANYDREDFEEKLLQGLIANQLYAKPDLSISELAAHLQIDKNSLRNFFRESDTSFKKYLNAKRIEKFKTLLKDDAYSNYSLVGLSTLVGFQSHATFFRVFKEMEGMTPSEFQRKGQQPS